MEQTDDENEVPVAALETPVEEDEDEEIPKKPCNLRIDELAKPNKRSVLSLWENYAQNFSPERRENIRLLLQELYAMTPEETAKYFDEINKVLKKLAARERLKKRLLKKYKQKVWRTERQRAYHKFEKLLKKGMIYANEHLVPPLVSPRIRNMADVILEQLCDIREIEMPDRADTDKQSQFLINVADWLAIEIEHIYYEIQVRKNKELDLIEAQIKAEEEAAKKALRTKSKSRRSSKSSARSKKTPDATPSA